jgi:pimeloyl-ACP methyl ester carboxylesterase
LAKQPRRKDAVVTESMTSGELTDNAQRSRGPVDSPFHTNIDIPVTRGLLRVAQAGPPAGAPIVLAVHGITSSHRTWLPVARRLEDDTTILAPDLRGRGASAALPGPYGFDAHVADLVAVLDHVGVDRAILAGHSMGAYLVARMAADHPGRVAAVVLVDGGLPLSRAKGIDIDAHLDAMLGPALARLRLIFPSRAAYREFWRELPALGKGWTSDIEAYIDYDLAGDEPSLHSRVAEDAVRADGRDLLDSEAVWAALAGIACPAVLLRAPRGLMDEPRPLLPDDIVAEAKASFADLVDVPVPDTNHYLVALGEREATTVAEQIRRLALQVS